MEFRGDKTMKLGFIGLGRMGFNMVVRLLERRHSVVVYNRSREPVIKATEKGAVGAVSIEELVNKLDIPRVIWIMVTSGDPVTDVIERLMSYLSKGDIVIDGGNSNYKDSIKRGKMLSEKGVNLLDVGTSGGIWGLEKGYCMMIGGDRKIFEMVRPIFESLALKDGYAYVGHNGSGHYVKMIHNAIEYGMLQAYAEGFALLEASGFEIDLGSVSHLWNHGSVIRSWLLELAENAFRKNPKLEGIKAYIDDSGEGRWAVLDSLEKDIPCPVTTHSLLYRLHSREDEPFTARFIAALRNEFGGHKIKKINDEND